MVTSPEEARSGMFADVREANWATIGLIASVYAGMNALANPGFVNSLPGVVRSIVPASTAPAALPALVVSTALPFGVVTLVVVFGIAFGYDSLRWKDFRWKREALLPAGLATIALWIVLQLVLLGAGGWTTSIEWSPSLDRVGIGQLVWGFAEQMLGNALAEETVFRALLISQLYLKFGGARSTLSWTPLAGSLAASQVFFSLTHVPHRLAHGLTGIGLLPNLGMLVVMGLVYAGIYLLSKNLFLAVGTHALYNDPVLLVAGSEDLAQLVLCACALLIALFLALRSSSPSSTDPSPSPSRSAPAA